MYCFISKLISKIIYLFLKFKSRILKFFVTDIYYVNGPETLPAPLTKEQESEILKKIMSGELTNRESLVVHNLRLVVYIAKKFEYNHTNLEDLISIGTIGLIKAVNTFCPEKNIKLATYASRCIENEILMHLRKISQIKNETSIDEPLSTDWDGNELLFSDILGSESDVITSKFEQESENKMLHNIVKQLSHREKTIMEMRFGLTGHKELTQKEVADSLGISQSYISRLEKRTILKLKKDLEKI
ncbi:MAG: RNA polymerase sporulation sigma factor SigE [Candidatus Improbicoccus devescovinae]|nr:MAG: RNA polymerase sporulation sigma factor SigE [Candidatus Improbicoccus devescovinae]